MAVSGKDYGPEAEDSIILSLPILRSDFHREPLVHMADEDSETKIFSSFEKHAEFSKAQAEFLKLDLTEEPPKEQKADDQALYQKLVDIVCVSAHLFCDYTS